MHGSLKQSISTDREERRLLRSVTCLNLRVLHRLCTEGNRSPKISHRAFQTCLYWKTYPNSCYVSLLAVFHLFYWEATVFILFLNTVCFLLSLFHTRERMCVSVCLLFTYGSCPSVPLDPHFSVLTKTHSGT